MIVHIQTDEVQDFLTDTEIEALFEHCLRAEQLIPHPHGLEAELSLLFCSNEYIQQLNCDYRGINKATDVLSFALYEDAFDQILKEQDELLLGDIVIAPRYVEAQALEYDHSPADELRLLLVHGLLHLLGYDHIDDEDAAKMEERERFLLSQLPAWGGKR